MDTRSLEVAAEFCKLVGKGNLVEYLGLEPGASPEDSRAKLKDRRRYMQGMQSNPKYKNEALFLIKNFGALDEVLKRPDVHALDMQQRAEESLLPVLEAAIKGVLAGGALSAEQVDSLSANALDLGVSSATFMALLERLAKEVGVPLPATRQPFSFGDDDEDHTDYFAVLGVDRRADPEEIRAAYERRTRAIKAMADRAAATRARSRLDQALQQALSGEEELFRGEGTTGPPARHRADVEGYDKSIHRAPTAPPARMRTFTASGMVGYDKAGPAPPPPADAIGSGTLGLPRRASRLEILGEPVRNLRVGRTQATAEITVRNGGDDPMPGRISTDAPWLLAQPTQLAPDQKEQAVTVRINPRDISTPTATGTVTIHTEKGERASIIIQVTKTSSLASFGLGAMLLVFAVAAAALLAWLASGVTGTPQVGAGTAGLTITVDPTAEEIRLDDVVVGSGASVYLAEPPTGPVTISASQPNFEPYSQQVVVHSGRPMIVPITLELARPLDFRPQPGMKKAPLEQEVARRIMGERSRAMESCVQGAVVSGATLSGSVRIHVGPSGHAVGVEIEGDGSAIPAVRSCLERQAAAVVLHPLREGDYVTVRYDYRVTEATPEP